MKAKYWVLLLLGVVGVASLSWIIVHQVSSGREVPSLWSMNDLPSPPPAEQNGFMLIALRQERIPELPAALRSLASSPSWGEAELHQGEIESLMSEQRVWLDVIKGAIQMPYFADGCGLRLEDRCHALRLVRLSELLRLEILHLALRGDWESAYSLSERILKADISLALSSRQIIISMIALSNLKRDLALLEVLLGQQPAPASLKASLEQMDLSTLSLRAPLIAEHLRLEEVLREFPESSSFFERLLLDHADTLLLHRAYTEGLLLFAQDPTRSSPMRPTVPPHSQWWWLYNPTGKLILGAISFEGTTQIKDFTAEKSQLQQKIKAVVSSQ